MVASAPGSSQDCGVGLDGAAIEGLRRMLLARGIRQLAIDDLRADEVAGLTWAGNIEAIITAARQYPLQGVKADELDKKLRYFEHNAHRMRYAGTATWACSSALAPSRRPARRSSPSAPSSPGCTGQSTAQPTSSRCAASKPAAGGTSCGHPPAPAPQRQPRCEQPSDRQHDLDTQASNH